MANVLTDEYITPLKQQADQARATATAYSVAGTTLPDELRRAVQEKLDYNQPLVEKLSQAESAYMGSAPATRERLRTSLAPEGAAVNPFQLENIVGQERALAYQPVSMYSNMLNQRGTSLNDLITTTTNAWKAPQALAESQAQSAEKTLASSIENYWKEKEYNLKVAELAQKASGAGSGKYPINIPGYGTVNVSGTGVLSYYNKVQDRQKLVNDVNYKLGIIDEVKNSLGKGLVTGPVTGRRLELQSGIFGGTGMTEQEQKLGALLGLVKSGELFSIGGKTITLTEKKELENYLPRWDLSTEANKQRLSILKDKLKSTLINNVNQQVSISPDSDLESLYNQLGGE